MKNVDKALQRLINQGKGFDSAQYPLERNMADGHDYMDNYPPQFDVWALKVKSVILSLFDQDTYEATLVNEAFADYQSFKTYRRRSSLDRIRDLLIAALKEALESANHMKEHKDSKRIGTMTILFLAANPSQTSALDLEEELRSLEHELGELDFVTRSH
jgi:hypothetical protein